MMRLSTLWRVDATIRDDGSSPVAEQMLERWAYDRGSLRFFRSSANFIYRFQQHGQGRFLRFAAASERRREMIEAELALVDTLAAAGLDVAVAISSQRGHAVETVETEWGAFHAVIFPALGGQQYKCEDLDLSGFWQWGGALGELHATLSARAASPALAAALAGRPTWRDHLAFIADYLPADASALWREYDSLAASLSALPVSPATYGLAHGDFELDNLIWQGSRVGMLDFDDCARLWYVADVTIALGDLLEAGSAMDDARCRAFVAGYREQHPLSEASLAQTPLFLRFAGMLRYARLARATDLATGSEYPQWLVALREKLLQRMADYRAAIETRSD